jgi:hypothetical protein
MQPLRHAPQIVRLFQTWVRYEVLNTATNVAWEQFCSIRGKPDYDAAWLSTAPPPKNNKFPTRIADRDINGKSLQEIVERFGVTQSKDTPTLHLLLTNELKDHVSESEVSVQPTHYLPFNRLLISYFTLKL